MGPPSNSQASPIRRRPSAARLLVLLRASVAQNRPCRAVLWLLLVKGDGGFCRRCRQNLRLKSHGRHPAPLNRRPIPRIGLGRPTRPLTVSGLLEPRNLLLPGPMAVHSGAREVPIRDLSARRRSLWARVGTGTAAQRAALKRRRSGRCRASSTPTATPCVARATSTAAGAQQAAHLWRLSWPLQFSAIGQLRRLARQPGRWWWMDGSLLPSIHPPPPPRLPSSGGIGARRRWRRIARCLALADLMPLWPALGGRPSMHPLGVRAS